MEKERCQKCGKELTPGISRYSWNAFGKPLCIECQKLERLEKYPKVMAEMINRSVESRGLTE